MTDVPLSGHDGSVEGSASIKAKRLSLSDGIHLGVILVGAVVYAVAANYDAMWFDEAYSFAIAQHPFAEIWDIGSHDVHPVLYYFALHVVYLLFGANAIAFRLFSVLGTVALSVLGFTHLRRDFGERCALLFSALVFLVPWSMHIAFQIRMYSWLAFVVMVAALYAWRIILALGAPAGGARAVRVHWWVILSLACLAAAYLHYYGAFAAFVVQLALLVSIFRMRDGRGRVLAIWAVCAVCDIALYLPWLFVAISQAKGVSGGFWIEFSFPTSFAQIAGFPFDTLEYEKSANGDWGISWQFRRTVIVGLLLAALLLAMVCACQYGKSVATAGKDAPAREGARRPSSPLAFFLLVFLGTAFIAGLATACMGQPILFFRYLSSCIGPVVFVMAFALSRIDSKPVLVGAGVLMCAFISLSFCGLVIMSYNPENDGALQEYAAMCDRAAADNGGRRPLVVAADEGQGSLVATSGLGERMYYADPQYKYKAFEPRYIIDEAWEDQFDDYVGEMVFVGSIDNAERFASDHGATLVDSVVRNHPRSEMDMVYSLIAFKEPSNANAI